MQFITIGVFTALSALLALGSNANAATFAVVDTTPTASLAWSGENESYGHLALTLPSIDVAADEVGLKLVTALAAPEPPAIVLAGMALGGLICGRSFLQKRRKATKETT